MKDSTAKDCIVKDSIAEDSTAEDCIVKDSIAEDSTAEAHRETKKHMEKREG